MKSFATFAAYLEDQSATNQVTIRALRRFVKRAEPGLVESVKWGTGVWLRENSPVAYVYSDVDLVQFGFFNGAALKDPHGLLEGKGKFVRHTKIRGRKDIDEKALAALLRQAVGGR